MGQGFSRTNRKEQEVLEIKFGFNKYYFQTVISNNTGDYRDAEKNLPSFVASKAEQATQPYLLMQDMLSYLMYGHLKTFNKIRVMLLDSPPALLNTYVLMKFHYTDGDRLLLVSPISLAILFSNNELLELLIDKIPVDARDSLFIDKKIASEVNASLLTPFTAWWLSTFSDSSLYSVSQHSMPKEKRYLQDQVLNTTLYDRAEKLWDSYKDYFVQESIDELVTSLACLYGMGGVRSLVGLLVPLINFIKVLGNEAESADLIVKFIWQRYLTKSTDEGSHLDCAEFLDGEFAQIYWVIKNTKRLSKTMQEQILHSLYDKQQKQLEAIAGTPNRVELKRIALLDYITKVFIQDFSNRGVSAAVPPSLEAMLLTLEDTLSKLNIYMYKSNEFQSTSPGIRKAIRELMVFEQAIGNSLGRRGLFHLYIADIRPAPVAGMTADEVRLKVLEAGTTAYTVSDEVKAEGVAVASSSAPAGGAGAAAPAEMDRPKPGP